MGTSQSLSVDQFGKNRIAAPANNITGPRSCVSFMDRDIRGIAAVGDKIYVIRYNHSHVSVYDSNTLCLKAPSHNIAVPDMTSPRDLAGCHYNRALYISDQEIQSIHRVDLTNNSITRWKLRVTHLPLGLSVTAVHTLLVTVWIRNTGGASRVVEYTCEGQPVREIKFDRSIKFAQQAVQLSSNQFVVCHGLHHSPLHRVCVVDTENQILKSYGRKWGGGEDQLWEPKSIAIDYNSKHVFVADHNNNRVLLLDTELTYISAVRTPTDFRWPSHLYFDSFSDRLLVDSKESLLSSNIVIKIIERDNQIMGVTVVDDEIFVIRHGRSQVDVYESSDLRTLRDIDVPYMEFPAGLAGCAYNRALYISEVVTACIYRVCIDSNFDNHWNMRIDQEPRGLSVTTQHTLLVTVLIEGDKGEIKAVEYTSKGEQLRDIKFDGSIKWAHQLIELSSDQFIVSHGGFRCPLHRVCQINAKGKIIKSYGKEGGSGEGHLCEPRSLALDVTNKHVFVGDCTNYRILMFDTDLNYLGQVPTPHDLIRPQCLYFDSSTNRLLVVDGLSGRLLVLSSPD